MVVLRFKLTRPPCVTLSVVRVFDRRHKGTTMGVRTYRGKWGQLTPWKNRWKITSENMQKEQFSEYFESNRDRQV